MEFIFPPGMSEEQKSFFRNQAERAQMQTDDWLARMNRFFDELNAEQLRTFSIMMARAKNDPGWGSYIEGMADAVLQFKFNICPGCGVNHDTDLEAAMRVHAKNSGEDELVQPDIQHFGDVPPIFDPSIPDDLSLMDVVPSPEFMNEEDPQQPGFDMAGNRLASCVTCHGDHYIKVCNHLPGSHGQSALDPLTCPEPMKVPCPECRTPSWYTAETLPESPCHPGDDIKILPLETPDRGVCSACGAEWAVNGAGE